MTEHLAMRVISAALDSPDELIKLVRAQPHLLEARTGLEETTALLGRRKLAQSCGSLG